MKLLSRSGSYIKFIPGLILPFLLLSIHNLEANESSFLTSNAKGTMSAGSSVSHSSGTYSSSIEPEKIPSLVKSANYSGSLDFCGSRIPVHIHDVRERLEKEMLLILWDRAQVILWIKRASQYFPHMERTLREYGLPLDLKYVAVIESGLRSQAGSHKGAVGTWQFMPGTGQDYGLRIDDNIDARKNLIESTRAACDYFKKLYARFNSWPLALAAYNMGENGLAKEMAQQEVYDYYRLYLPQETQRYVFRAIVAREIMENPAKYGFFFSKEDYYPVLDFARVTVDCPARIPLTLVARAAKSYFKEIKDLNPDIRGYYLDKGRYSILIPPGMDKVFYQEFAKEISRYQAVSGQAIEQQSGGMKTGENSQPSLNIIRQQSSKDEKRAYSAAKSSNRHHVVRVGDSLTGIAQSYGISFDTLLKLNNLNKKSVIHPGQKLIVRP
ncbi:MAG: transglycosylase SLT domain-containing protein [Desulfamplus sp.]|nr:transglycosylase SLT domain-containing protein [Desulfamplus sp.]